MLGPHLNILSVTALLIGIVIEMIFVYLLVKKTDHSRKSRQFLNNETFFIALTANLKLTVTISDHDFYFMHLFPFFVSI